MAYQTTWLWTRAFVDPRTDSDPAEQSFFRERYVAMREKAAALVGRIGADLKDMTVHDVTHLDALWEMGSIVTEDALDLSPPEAFVFGGAILLHDAAMTLAAYPGGLHELQDTLTWKDIYGRLLAHDNGSDESQGTTELKNRATAEALRRLHAEQAEQLPLVSWDGPKGQQAYLIDDPEVRNFYGPTIGRVAHSHWWSVTTLEEEFANDLGPLGGRTSSRVDVTKVACLLRISDAMHLDRRRAPSFLRALVHPQGVSQDHWTFQERMAAPFIENEALVYSANPPFELAVADAWWLAFDALTMVDNELRNVDHLLHARGRQRFKANRVKGSASPKELAALVGTAGWEPVDSTVRVSDVPKIVATLGGRKLYGENPAAALRELIQNAADAVEVRRRLQRRPPHWGSINIELQDRSGEHWLVIDDTGIGMSERVMTGPLIDFGNSFWRSSLASEEFPGIHASGVTATGRYGIGFFSVFMLGSRVRVISRRFDKEIAATRVLEFNHGLASRPVLYHAQGDGSLPDGGTRVEVLLSHNPAAKGGLLYVNNYRPSARPLGLFVASLAPTLSVDVYAITPSGRECVVGQDDWLTMSENRLLSRLAAANDDEDDWDEELEDAEGRPTRLRELRDDDGRIFGRAMIETDALGSGGYGCITIGGLRSSKMPYIRGVLAGREVTAARNQATFLAPPHVFAAWASEQADLLAASKLTGEDQARGAQVVLYFGGRVGGLAIARRGGEWLNERALREILSANDEVMFCLDDVTYEEDWDDVHPREFSHHFQENKEIIFVPSDVPRRWDEREDIMAMRPAHGGPRHLADFVRDIVSDIFGEEYEETEREVSVGSVQGTAIERDVTLMRSAN